MIDIPLPVFQDILRDSFMHAFNTSLETGRLDEGQKRFDDAILKLHHALECGVYREVQVIEEVRGHMGEHAHMLTDLDVREMVLCQLSVHGEPAFEAGRMTIGDDGRYPSNEEMEAFGEPAIRALGKATVKCLRAHDMAGAMTDIESNPKGALGEIFHELLREVIDEEIEDQCAQFRDGLADMLTVEHIPKPWTVPVGAPADLPPPKGGEESG